MLSDSLCRSLISDFYGLLSLTFLIAFRGYDLMMYDSCNSWNKVNNDDDADVDYDLINCLLLLSVGANII